MGLYDRNQTRNTVISFSYKCQNLPGNAGPGGGGVFKQLELKTYECTHLW